MTVAAPGGSMVAAAAPEGIAGLVTAAVLVGGSTAVDVGKVLSPVAVAVS